MVLYASPLSFLLWPCLLKTYTWSWVIQCISPYASCLSSTKSWERADRLNERGERTTAESLTSLQKCMQPVKQGWCWQIPVWLSLSLLHRSRGNRCFSPLLLVGTKFFCVKAIKAGHCPVILLKQTPWEDLTGSSKNSKEKNRRSMWEKIDAPRSWSLRSVRYKKLISFYQSAWCLQAFCWPRLLLAHWMLLPNGCI